MHSKIVIILLNSNFIMLLFSIFTNRSIFTNSKYNNKSAIVS